MFSYGMYPARIIVGKSIRGVIKGRFRDELLNTEPFGSPQETKLFAEQHRIEYNVNRLYAEL